MYDNSTTGELKQAWGSWLTELGDHAGGWDWWFTGTFRDIEREGSWTRPGWKYTSTAYDRFMSHLRDRRGIGEATWVRGREYQHWRGVPHFHALIGNVEHLRRDEAWTWWFERYGMARIEPYDRSLGAGYYLCKYVTKELGDIEFSPGLTI